MASFEFLAVILTGLGLTASLFYYARVLENANKTREMQLFMQMYNILHTRESLQNMIELANIKVDEDEYRQKYDSYVNPEHFGKRARIWYTYNSIGEMLRLKMVEPDLLHRLNVDINVILIWKNWEHIIKLNRKRENMPDLWDGFEYLYNEMKRLRKDMGYPDITYNP